MFKALRLRKIHAKFLESCRNLKEGRTFWDGVGPIRRGFLQAIIPVPLMGLHEDGQLLLEALTKLEAHCRDRPLNEDSIRNYHRMIAGSKIHNPGGYRKRKIRVTGSSISRAAPDKVPALMKQLEVKLQKQQEKFDAMTAVEESEILRIAVDTYQRIGFIHPFENGNGRVSRLALNHLLRRYGLGYVIYPPLSEPSPLWAALEDANRGNIDPLVEYARKCSHHV